MAKISRESIENIRNRLTLVDIASLYTQLKRVGTQYRGLSPFTEEKTPSFYIHPEKNVFKCYSSGYAGDLFRFVELKENLPFHEAVEWVANRFQIPIQYEDNHHQDTTHSLKKTLYLIHEAAAIYFHEQFLASTKEGQTIRDYWENQRHFSLTCAKTYLIGYAPHEPYALADYLKNKHFSPETLHHSGFFYTKNQSTTHYPLKSRFLGRLMIPIRDIQGRIIAFTGRTTPLSSPQDPTYDAKYINSPETLLFNKSQIVFGLDHARKHTQDTDKKGIIIVEGQLDAIRCWENQLHTAVAPQGTSITDQQLHLIKRYQSIVNFVMDGDAAGQRAALRVLPMAIHSGLIPYFISLPNKEDPDSFLTQQGIEKWNALFNARETDLNFILKYLAPDGRSSSPHIKSAALEKIFTIYSQADSPIILESALKTAGEHLSISEHTIFERFLKNQKKSIPIPKNNSQDPGLTNYIDILLIAACHHSDIMYALANQLPLEWIDNQLSSGVLLKRFLAIAKENLWQGLSHLHEYCENQDEQNYFYQIVAREPLEKNNIHKAAQEAFQSLHKEYFLKQKERLTNLIANTDPLDNKALTFLQNERIKIRQLLKERPNLNFS